MNLSKRLLTIASCIPKDCILADVGCDHGYLPIWLVQQRRIRKAIAMDINTGPLERAKLHIREAGLGNLIETRLSDGLSALRPGECDALVIAGMGGPLMERILEEGQELLPGFQEMVLQPQSDLPHFRRWLHRTGLAVTDEKMVKEDGKFYNIIKAKAVSEMPEFCPDGISEEVLMYCGQLLLERKDPVLFEYLDFRMRICRGIEEKLEVSEGIPASERKKEIEREKAVILAALGGF